MEGKVVIRDTSFDACNPRYTSQHHHIVILCRQGLSLDRNLPSQPRSTAGEWVSDKCAIYRASQKGKKTLLRKEMRDEITENVTTIKWNLWVRLVVEFRLVIYLCLKLLLLKGKEMEIRGCGGGAIMSLQNGNFCRLSVEQIFRCNRMTNYLLNYWRIMEISLAGWGWKSLPLCLKCISSRTSWR